MSSESRTTEKKIEEFQTVISKLKKQETKLESHLMKGGQNLAFDIPASIFGIRRIISVFEAALWVAQNPEGEWKSEIFEAKDELKSFAGSIKDLIDAGMKALEANTLDRGTDYVLGTYLRAVNDAYEELAEYTDRHMKELLSRVDKEFPPDPEEKRSVFFRKRRESVNS